MGNSTKVLDCIIIAINIISWIFFPAFVSLIIGIFSVLYGLVYIIGDKTKITKQITTWIYKLSFPYTTDEVIILNVMQVVNFFIGKRFQILFWLNRVKEKPSPVTDKTIFFDDFDSFNKNNWYTVFPWGDSYNVDHNVHAEDSQLITRMRVEDHRGWWDDRCWDFKVTSGMIYSVNIFPAIATYSAKIKFSNTSYTNQAYWLLRLRDVPLPKIIEEEDFEYYQESPRITTSEHWGNGYKKEQFHRQNSFNFKIDLSKDWHVLKFVIKRHTMFWYIDDKLVKWHFIGVPKLEQHIIFGIGYGDKAEDPTNIGKLDLKQLPAYFKCDWIKVDKN